MARAMFGDLAIYFSLKNGLAYNEDVTSRSIQPSNIRVHSLFDNYCVNAYQFATQKMLE